VREARDRALQAGVRERGDPAAAVAHQVVVMVLVVGAPRLVARGAVAHVDAPHEPQLLELAERPVDAREANALPGRAEVVVDLTRAERAAQARQLLHDGAARAAPAAPGALQRRERGLSPVL